MFVTVKFKYGLEKYTGNHTIEYDFDGKKTLADLLNEIRFPTDKIGIILINGVINNLNYQINGKEIIKILPKIT